MSVQDVGSTRGGLGEFLVGLPLLIGGGYLFFDSIRVQLYFRPQSLMQTLIMLAMIAAGVGLIAKAVRAH